jgi:hypothetical protein
MRHLPLLFKLLLACMVVAVAFALISVALMFQSGGR